MTTKPSCGELLRRARPGKIAAQAALLALLASHPAYADPIKLHIACTATSDCASAMVARDEGIFAKHGIDADMTLIGINTNIPPAIVSDSIQVGGPTSPVFLQAVSGGLDLVAIEGASTMDAASDGAIAVVTRNGVTAHEAKDFVGKKVGAPGIGAFLQVLFVKWLMEKGVDPKSVNFVEVTFPTMSDALKSGAVDAVVTAEPFISRITKAGNGAVGARYAAELGRTDPIISFVTTREFAAKNPDAVKAFRAAIEEAAPIVNNDHEKTAASISKFTKQPIEIVRANVFSHASPTLKGSDFTWWLEVMKQQDMLQAPIDVEKLVAP